MRRVVPITISGLVGQMTAMAWAEEPSDNERYWAQWRGPRMAYRTQRNRTLVTRFLCAVFALLAPATALAQQSPPATDIYLVALDSGAPKNVTARQAYDNQPAFLPDGSGLLFTSYRDDGQTDILLYDLETEASRAVTRTPESEYSATPILKGQWFSVVRVEEDGTQRLWKFPLEGGAPELVLRDIKPVGYHAWIDEQTLALFVLGEPPTLQLADTETGRSEIVASSIGRSIHRIPGRERISFVHKVDEQAWWIQELDPKSKKIDELVQTLAGHEDYAWTPEGNLLMASGSKLYRWSQENASGGWQQVADWMSAGVRNVTRLDVDPSGKLLAFVADAQGQ